MVPSPCLLLTFEFVFTTVTKSGRQSEISKRSGLFFPKIGKTQLLQLEHTLKYEVYVELPLLLKN